MFNALPILYGLFNHNGINRRQLRESERDGRGHVIGIRRPIRVLIPIEKSHCSFVRAAGLDLATRRSQCFAEFIDTASQSLERLHIRFCEQSFWRRRNIEQKRRIAADCGKPEVKKLICAHDLVVFILVIEPSRTNGGIDLSWIPTDVIPVSGNRLTTSQVVILRANRRSKGRIVLLL